MREVSKKKERQQCKICHKKTFYVSQNGLCKDCSANLVTSANFQMKTKEGPIYDKWKKKVIKSLDKL